MRSAQTNLKMKEKSQFKSNSISILVVSLRIQPRSLERQEEIFLESNSNSRRLECNLTIHSSRSKT
jgi:DNA-binding transcriptional regulator PaaX